MTYAPEAVGVRAHETHRFIGGRCHRCGTSPRWPIAAQECPLRTYEGDPPKWTTEKTRRRMMAAFLLLDDGVSIKETARRVGVDRKTLQRYKRLRAQGE